MAFQDALLRQGFVPAGTDPKTITSPGGEASFQDTSRSGNLLRALQTLTLKTQEEKEKKEKKLKRQTDLYKTLRDAGYSPQKAYDAVLKDSGLPAPGEDVDDELERDKKRADIEKTKASTKKVEAETTKIEDEAASNTEEKKLDLDKKRADILKTSVSTQKTLSDLKSANKKTLREKILDKVATGGVEALTPGEKTVYRDVIRKASSLGKKIPVTDPEGNDWKVSRDKLEDAIKKGFKIRWDDLE